MPVLTTLPLLLGERKQGNYANAHCVEYLFCSRLYLHRGKKQQQYLQIQSRHESRTVYMLTRKQSRQSETNIQEIYSRVLCFLSTLINLPLAD